LSSALNHKGEPVPSTLTSTEPRPVTSADVEQIPYERQVPWYAQRRSFYIIVFMMLLNAIATTSVTWGPPTLAALREWRAARRAKEQQAQAEAARAAAKAAAVQKQQALEQKLLQFTLPETDVVYTEDPAEAERLLLSGQGYSTVRWSGPRLSRLPHLPVLRDAGAELRQMLSAVSWQTSERDGTIFLHERRTPAGRSRLVWVRVSASRTLSNEPARESMVLIASRSLLTVVAQPAGPAGDGGQLWSHILQIVQPPSRALWISTRTDGPSPDGDEPATAPPPPPREVMRILAGRPDPQNPSHFTIHYTLDGQPGVIDGWLQDDDRVRLEPREGAKRLGNIDSRTGSENWDPRGVSTKRPSTTPAEPSPAR
jgi:hypothetical protein